MQDDNFQEVVEILQSMRTINDVRIEIGARAFGVEWAAASGRQATYTGLCKSWLPWTSKGLLYVKWEDCEQYCRVELFGLRLDEKKKPLGLRLLPYLDGRPPPVKDAPQPNRRSTTIADNEEEEEEEAEEELEEKKKELVVVVVEEEEEEERRLW